MERPLVLGIESSCDDTACAVVDGVGRVLSSSVSSQLRAHGPYGGVVPEIASREHLRNWPAVLEQALDRAHVRLPEIDAFAATRGPGLVGSLLVGLSIGRAMAFARQRPFYGVHHLEGHVDSPFLTPDGEPAAPVPERFTALVVSGGHSSLLEVTGHRVTSLGETRDDAIGEVFDKVGKRVGLHYPQGPKVDQLAERGTPDRGAFRVRGRDELFFSYSGLKSQTLRALEALEAADLVPTHARYDDLDAVPQPICDLLASFRDAAVRQIIDRVERLNRRAPVRTLAVSGGVAANRLLRRELTTWAQRRSVDLRLVPLPFAGDNAAMIAFSALRQLRRGQEGDPRDAVVASRIPFPTFTREPTEATNGR